MAVNLCSLFLAALPLVSPAAYADTGPPAPADKNPAATGGNPTAGKPNPTVSGDTLAPDSNRVRLEFGSLSSLATGGRTSAYYLFEYQGNSLFAHNSPPTFVNPLGLTKLPDAPTPDPNTFSFSIERQQPGSNIADGNFLAHRVFNLGGKSQILGVLQFTPRSNFKQVNIAGGLETPTIPFLALLNAKPFHLNIVNWVHFGVQGENQTRPDSEGGDQDVALLTYRAYVGKGFLPVERDVNRKAREGLSFDAVRNLTETPEGNVSPDKIRALAQKFSDADAGGTLLSDVEQKTVFALKRRLINDQVKQENGEQGDLFLPTGKVNDAFLSSANFKNELVKLSSKPTTEAGAQKLDIARSVWEEWVATQFIPNAGKPVKDAAKIELYAESAGWYYLNGHFQTDRFQNLFSVNFKYHLHPEKATDDVWFRLRYENGTDRASPLIYRNFLSASLGISFK